MANGPLTGVIRTLRRATRLPEEARMTDGQLLRDYLRRRDEAALATLVERHAPMVWGVCCRVLAEYHDAEGVFQATFLTLGNLPALYVLLFRVERPAQPPAPAPHSATNGRAVHTAATSTSVLALVNGLPTGRA